MSTVRRMSAGSVLSGLSLNLTPTVVGCNHRTSKSSCGNNNKLTMITTTASTARVNGSVMTGTVTGTVMGTTTGLANMSSSGRATCSRSPSISSTSVTAGSSVVIATSAKQVRRSNGALTNGVSGGGVGGLINSTVGSTGVPTTIAVGTRFRFRPIGGQRSTAGSDIRRAEFYSNYYDWRECRDDVVVNGEVTAATASRRRAAAAAAATIAIASAGADDHESYFDDDDHYFNTINKNVMKKRFAANAEAHKNINLPQAPKI